ncbi:MAG: DnaA regulatory inactivator Hda [Proteobacteria bacterium]|nr:DnaA regulatory inactivator Hda [Pseudomonadota bacterium]
MSAPATQLTLRLTHQEIYRLDNYYFSQPEINQALTEFCDLQNMDFVYLWGEAAVGKSHLLIACAEKVQLSGVNVIYLSLAELMATAEPEILQSIEQPDLLCLDDIDVVVGKKAWEEALFHCFNRVKVSGGKILIAADKSPANIEFSLPDLRSRLATALVYQLPSMSDEDKQQALIIQAQSRGLILSEDVAQHLLRHYGREMVELMAVLHKLDNASLAEKRRLTIPFVSQVLANG